MTLYISDEFGNHLVDELGNSIVATLFDNPDVPTPIALALALAAPSYVVGLADHPSTPSAIALALALAAPSDYTIFTAKSVKVAARKTNLRGA